MRLEDQPAQAALSANLRYADYVRFLPGTLDQLPQDFAHLDGQPYVGPLRLERKERNAELRGGAECLPSHWLDPSPFIAVANDCHDLDQSSERRMGTTSPACVQDHGSGCLNGTEGCRSTSQESNALL